MHTLLSSLFLVAVTLSKCLAETSILMDVQHSSRQTLDASEGILRSGSKSLRPWPEPPPMLGIRKGPLVSNTLTGSKVEFRPQDGRTVKWYICGPTVYDSAHLGHARTYIAFDMIRRILEDFFGFDVLCVINITDIDDKIIIRARQRFLLKQYSAAKPSLSTVIDDAQRYLDNVSQRLLAHKSDLSTKLLAVSEGSKERKCLQDALDAALSQELRFSQHANTIENARHGGIDNVGELLKQLEDVMAQGLDEERGSEIEDAESFREHAAGYEKEFLEDMQALGIRMPDVLPRVSEFIPDIVSYIQRIMENGCAYASQGSVYFDIGAFTRTHQYRKLSVSAAGNRTALQEGEGALSSGEGKRFENDFALWKKSKAGEPGWSSPWGRGRPGWHIECSVMASKLLGDTIDIHSGGVDLCFPHHDNELAQAEAYFGHQQWVNYFLHSGHLCIGYQKMSKSLKNFFTIREILKGGSKMRLSEDAEVELPAYTARQLRILFAMFQWDQDMVFSKDSLDAAVVKEKTFKDFFGTVRSLAREEGSLIHLRPQTWGDEELALWNKTAETQALVQAALCDNFNTPKVLQHLLELVSACNVYMNARVGAGSYPSVSARRFLLVHKASSYISKTLRLLGIDDEPTYAFSSASSSVESDGLFESVLDACCTARLDIRQAAIKRMPVEWLVDYIDRQRNALVADLRFKPESQIYRIPSLIQAFRDWLSSIEAAAQAPQGPGACLAHCDRLRDEVLPTLGIRLSDKPEGSGYSWQIDDPSVLAQERASKLAAAAEARRRKVEDRLAKALKDLAKWEGCSRPAAEALRGMTSQYSRFDAEGVPTHAATGEQLSRKQRQTAEKEFKKRQAEWAQYRDLAAAQPDFLDRLRAEIEELRLEKAALD